MVDLAAVDLKPLLEGATVVVHLAQSTGPEEQDDQAQGDGALARRVLDAASAVGTEHVVLLSSAIAYGLELLALRRVPTRVFGILMSLEPAAAAIFGFLVVRELLTGWDLLALALVIVASAGVALTAARARRPAPPSTGPITGLVPPLP